MPPEPVRRLTVQEYHKIIQAGILQEDEAFELLEGWLVPKMVRNAPHDLALVLAEDEIGKRLPPAWIRRVQSGVTTSDSEPEPDIAVVRGPRRRHHQQHPGPKDIEMVVEVSDATLRRDQTVKQRINARAKIPVYWIINLLEMQIEVYSEPTGSKEKARFRQRRNYAAARMCLWSSTARSLAGFRCGICCRKSSHTINYPLSVDSLAW
jgi:Uma2 family endonuclease